MNIGTAIAFNAGGSQDVIARMLAKHLEAAFNSTEPYREGEAFLNLRCRTRRGLVGDFGTDFFFSFPAPALGAIDSISIDSSLDGEAVSQTAYGEGLCPLPACDGMDVAPQNRSDSGEGFCSISREQKLRDLGEVPVGIHPIENPDHVETILRPIRHRRSLRYEKPCHRRNIFVLPRH